MIISLLFAVMMPLSMDTLRTSVNDLDRDFAASENSLPGAGYYVQFQYDKTLKNWSGLCSKRGNRKFDTPMSMPQDSLCVFCAEKPIAQFKDIMLFRSKSDRILLVPKKHTAHWFLTKDAQKVKLLKSALKLACIIEEQFEGVLTSENQYRFGFHCGSYAGQTISHVHLRFESGDNEGVLTDEQWMRLTSCLTLESV